MNSPVMTLGRHFNKLSAGAEGIVDIAALCLSARVREVVRQIQTCEAEFKEGAMRLLPATSYPTPPRQP
jgi:hypothetical protein